MGAILSVRSILIGILVFCSAAPAVAQSADGREPMPPPASLLPYVCLTCDPSSAPPTGYELGSEALPRGVVPVIGGVVGAVVGLVAMRISCANRSCEMADLGGILGGAVFGVTIGQAIEGTLPPSPR